MLTGWAIANRDELRPHMKPLNVSDQSQSSNLLAKAPASYTGMVRSVVWTKAENKLIHQTNKLFVNKLRHNLPPDHYMAVVVRAMRVPGFVSYHWHRPIIYYDETGNISTRTQYGMYEANQRNNPDLTVGIVFIYPSIDHTGPVFDRHKMKTLFPDGSMTNTFPRPE